MIFIRQLTILLYLLLVSSSILYTQTSSDDFIPLTGIADGIGTPMRIAVDAQDNIYVADVNLKCILKYDASGSLVATLAQGSFPVSIAISPDGDIFYGDGLNGNIYNLGAGGQMEEFYSGTQYPTSLVFSPDQVLYVADNELKKVLVIDLSGDLIGSIGVGHLVFPTGIAYDSKNDRILVAEHGGIGGDVMSQGWWGKGPFVTIHTFDRQGNALGLIGSAGNGNGKFYRLQGLTVGRCGNIYVCEPFQGNISVFTEDGNFITKFSEYGNGPGQLILPMDIAFDSQDRIIISSYNKGNLELFTIDDPTPSAKILTPYVASCLGTQGDIAIQLTGTAPWSITYIFNGSDPITIDNINSSPFVLAMTEPGDFEITAVADAFTTGTCIAGAATVSFHPEPTAVIRNGDQIICEGSYGEIPIYFTGDSPWTFAYTQDGVNPKELSTTHNPHMLEVTEAGVYTLTSISGSNCEGSIIPGSATISITPLPSASFTDGEEYFQVFNCQNEPPPELEVNFTGTAPWAFTYMVNDENPTEILTFANPYFLTATQSGIYEIILVSDNSCSSTDTYGTPDVILRDEPTVHITLPELGLCPTTTNYIPMEFTGTAPWTFGIRKNGAPPDYVTTSENPYLHPVNRIGTYTITSLTDLHCTGNPAGVSIHVGHANPPSASLPGDDIILCEGQTAEVPIDFSGTEPWTFTYDMNGSNATTITSRDNPYILTVNTVGALNITALSDANCDARHLPNPATVVQYPMPVADYTYFPNGLQISYSNISLNATDFMWMFGDGNTSTEENPIHVYELPGEYTVTLESGNAECGTVTYSEIIFVESLKNFGLNADDNATSDISNEDLEVSVYPNPGEGLFILELSGLCSDDIYIEVISMSGRIQYTSRPNLLLDLLQSGTVTQEVNLTGFAQGMYQLRVSCGEQVVTKLLSVVRK